MSFWGRLKGYLGSSPYRIHGRGSVQASHYSAKKESLNLREARNKSRDLIRNSAVMATLHKTIIGEVLGLLALTAGLTLSLAISKSVEPCDVHCHQVPAKHYVKARN